MEVTTAFSTYARIDATGDKSRYYIYDHSVTNISISLRQHIDSFNHFINLDIKKIVAAKSNFELRSEADPKFFLRYTDIYVGKPNIEEEAFVTSNGRCIIF